MHRFIRSSSDTHPRLARRLRDATQRAAGAVRRIIGAPDYERYLAHVRLVHPDTTPLSRDDFMRDRLARRYEQPGAKCC